MTIISDRPSKHCRIGFVVWEGPSLFDNQPIVIVATGLGKRWRTQQANRKTGDAVQTWILHQDIPPTEARRSGADYSVCGDCPLTKNRGCYVTSSAPTWTWKTYKAGGYYRLDTSNPAHMALFSGRVLRIGSYGDPAATPLGAWRPLIDAVAAHTGYTHAWRRCAWQWREYVQASCSTLQEALEARVRGYSTFRILRPGEAPGHRETPCPSDVLTCKDCRGCRGGRSRNRTIPLHGSPVVRRAYLQTIGG